MSALLLYNCTTVSYKSMLLSEVQKYNELRTRKWPVEKFKVATTSIKAVKCSNAIFRLPAWLHPAKFGLYFPSSSSSLYTCKIFISTTIYILVSRRYCRHYILEKKSVPYKKKRLCYYTTRKVLGYKTRKPLWCKRSWWSFLRYNHPGFSWIAPGGQLARASLSNCFTPYPVGLCLCFSCSSMWSPPSSSSPYLGDQPQAGSWFACSSWTSLPSPSSSPHPTSKRPSKLSFIKTKHHLRKKKTDA